MTRSTAQGASLPEMVAIMVLIGILSVAILPNVGSVRTDAEGQRVETIQATMLSRINRAQAMWAHLPFELINGTYQKKSVRIDKAWITGHPDSGYPAYAWTFTTLGNENPHPDAGDPMDEDLCSNLFNSLVDMRQGENDYRAQPTGTCGIHSGATGGLWMACSPDGISCEWTQFRNATEATGYVLTYNPSNGELALTEP